MEPVTVLHPQLFVREQFQDGSENISDCTLHLHCCIHHIFSIELWFVRRPWRYSILELHVRNDDDDDGGAAPLSRSPCYGALECVVTLLLLLLSASLYVSKRGAY